MRKILNEHKTCRVGEHTESGELIFHPITHYLPEGYKELGMVGFSKDARQAGKEIHTWWFVPVKLDRSHKKMQKVKIPALNQRYIISRFKEWARDRAL